MTQTTPSLTAVRRRVRPSRTLPFLVVGLLLAFLLVFFVLPVLWLLLAPSKTAGEVVRDNPLSFGSFHQIGTAWRHLFAFQDGAMSRWLLNSAIYSGGSLILTLAVSVPAGYALALTKFRGRKTLLVITLVTMIMPQATLVLPIFLELNRFHLIGTVWSVILPFSFYPFGVYLVYIYFGSSLPGTCCPPRASTAAPSGSSSHASRCRSPNRWSDWSRSSASWATGTTSSCPISCCRTASSSPSRWA